MGLLFFVAFTSHMAGGKPALGHVGDDLAQFFIAGCFGLSAFFIPTFFFYLAYEAAMGGTRYTVINKAMLWGKIFAVFFFLNVYLLNIGELFDSDVAGLFPKLIHVLTLNYFGEKRPLGPSIGSHLVELSLCLISLAMVIQRMPERHRQWMRYVLKTGEWHRFLAAVFRRLMFISIQGRQKLVEIIRQEKRVGALIRRIEGSEERAATVEEVPPHFFFKRINEFPVSLPQEGNDSPSSTWGVPILASKEESSKEGEEADVDIDLSRLSFFDREGEDSDKTDSSENDTSIPDPFGNESMVTIDPQKTPSVLNPWSSEASCEEDRRVLANVHLLESSPRINHHDNMEESIRRTAVKLEKTIEDFGIQANVVQVSTGPVITQYELTIEPGVKLSRVVNLADNIALSLAAPSVRIVAPIPGKGVIGIEIPNPKRQSVRLRDIVESKGFASTDFALPVVLGKSLLGMTVIKDIASTPHLLIAGATGSGKSVCVNGILASLLFKRNPREVRFILIDPKMVELNVYNGIPHLLAPVITDPKKAALALRWVIAEMESRYYLLEKYSARSISSYNDIICRKIEEGESIEDNLGTLPYIVVIIDEFADLMMIARKEIEDSVSRLAAMSRAVGIHLILATQRPSVDVITGIIKANFPSRIAFQVSSKVDSRTIIDENGAEQLLGKGDMLYSDPTSPIPERIQGAFLSDEEVNRVVRDLKQRGETNYLEDIFAIGENTDKDALNDIQEKLFDEAVWIVISDKKASASYLQRKLKIGYNRAARIVEKMEELGVVGSADGSRPREVLITEWQGINHS